MKKIIPIILVLVLILGTLTVSYAGTDIIGRLKTQASGASTDQFNKLGGSVIGVMQVAATVVAIALLLFVGVKFMMAAPAEKANLKGALIPYIVGAVLIFAAIPLLSMIKNFADNNIS